MQKAAIISGASNMNPRSGYSLRHSARLLCCSEVSMYYLLLNVLWHTVGCMSSNERRDMPRNAWLLDRAEFARLNRLIRVEDAPILDAAAPSEAPTTPCWTWLGNQTSNGYGKWQRGPGHREKAVHRTVWQHYKNQEIPKGLQLDHLCRNRICCNPEHMEVVTPSENTKRQDHKERRKTHCPRGHAYDEENTRRTKSGKRQCRACDRLRWERRKYVSAASHDRSADGTENGEPPSSP